MAGSTVVPVAVDVAVDDVPVEDVVCEIKAFNSATNCASPPPSWWWWRVPWAGVAALAVVDADATVAAAFGSVATAGVAAVVAEVEAVVFCACKESNKFLSKAIKACEIWSALGVAAVVAVVALVAVGSFAAVLVDANGVSVFRNAEAASLALVWAAAD